MKTNFFKTALLITTFAAGLFIYSCDNDKTDDNETKKMNTNIDTTTANTQQNVSTDSNSDKGSVATDTVSFGKMQVSGTPDSSKK